MICCWSGCLAHRRVCWIVVGQFGPSYLAGSNSDFCSHKHLELAETCRSLQIGTCHICLRLYIGCLCAALQTSETINLCLRGAHYLVQEAWGQGRPSHRPLLALARAHCTSCCLILANTASLKQIRVNGNQHVSRGSHAMPCFCQA